MIEIFRFSNVEMYDVVADVKNYSKFVPFCTKSTILSENLDEIRANLEVGFPPIIENYTSTVLLSQGRAVRAVCKDGRLFTTLVTNWKFNPGLKSNPKSCIVDFNIKFEFKSALYSQIAGLFFQQLVEQMEDAFINEAKKRYGQESLPVYQLEAAKS